MNSCCAIYHVDSEIIEEKKINLDDLEDCNKCGCSCGYIQFESLVPYMDKLSNNYTQDDDHIKLEAKIRQQIIEISRLLDLETQVLPGHYSEAHYSVIKLYGDGTRYLKIPDFIEGTLELYTNDGYLINPNSYGYRDGFLIINPCNSHNNTCGCTNNCGYYSVRKNPPGWKGCLQAKAKFGSQCSNSVIHMAVRDYLIEHLTFSDIKLQVAEGITVARSFKVPNSWATVVKNNLQKRNFRNQFSFA